MSKNIVLKRGLDIPIEGSAELRLSKTITPDIVAIQPTDFKGFSPRLLVKEGDKVLCGSPVMSDKKNADILLASPVSGTVKEIVRGAKRKLLAVLVQPDAKQENLAAKVGRIEALTPEQIKETILRSGLWPFIVQRPYGIVADPAVQPKAIFVSAFATAPLAASPEFTLGDRIADIQAGINALAALTEGGVHLGLNADNYAGTPFHKLENAIIHTFKGRHPAGNVGVQISHICPILKGTTVWTISLYGLAAIGRYFNKSVYDVRRKIAVAGPMAIQPAYAETLPGAPMSSLAAWYGGNAEGLRIISGDVLSGKAVGPDGYLGFFDDTVTILKEGTDTELFGWAKPVRWGQFSTDHSYFSWLTPWRKYAMDTNLHGGPRAFVMNDAYYSKVLPMDIFPIYLVKACLAGDIDKMEKFGIYEVLPEDLALCEFIDPSKNHIQDMIAQGIDLMLKEMA